MERFAIQFESWDTKPQSAFAVVAAPFSRLPLLPFYTPLAVPLHNLRNCQEAEQELPSHSPSCANVVEVVVPYHGIVAYDLGYEPEQLGEHDSVVEVQHHEGDQRGI